VVTIQGALFIVVAVPFGLRAPVLGLLLGLILVGLLGAAFAALSYAVALRVKNEDALAPILNGLALPLLLLSGILLPMSIAPAWLQALSDVNPIKHAVDGMRAAIRGDYTIGGMGWGLGAVILMLMLGLGFGLRTFQRESA
jgi:ABC-2 type transport system permease protein